VDAGLVDLRHPRVARDRTRLEVERQLRLELGRDRRRSLTEQRGDRLPRRRFGQYLVLVGTGERSVLASATDDLTDLVGVRVGRPRVAEPPVTDDPDPDPAGLRELEPLDLAAEGARLGVARFLRVGLDGLAGLGGVDGDATQVGEIRHRSPPP
jgi:hypothetical protein